MKAKIFSFVKVADDSMVASVRIAKFVSEKLQLPIVCDNSIADEPLDVLIIINGAYAFSSALESLGAAIEQAGRVVWVQNDYTVIPPKDESGAESPFRKAFRTRHHRGQPAVDYWTTVQTMTRPGVAPSGHRIGDRSQYINWNCLTTVEREVRPWSERSCPGSMLYYGSFRKGRKKYFDRYFSAPLVPVVISCPNSKFEAEYTNANVSHESKLYDLYDYLSHFGLGLYIEDKDSHLNFHSPANRFYEMLSAGLPIVFQPEAAKMMAKAGFEIEDFEVWNADDVPNMMEKAQDIGADQRNRWWSKVLADRQALDTILDSIWSAYV